MTRFKTTRWDLVNKVKDPTDPEFRENLAELCGDFHDALLHEVRRITRYDEQRARDGVQRLIVDLCARGVHPSDPGRRKFRTWLIYQTRDHLKTLRRQAKDHLSLDAHVVGGASFEAPDPGADQMFDAQWALAVVRRALDELALEAAQSSNPERHACACRELFGMSSEQGQAATAAKLGITPGTWRTHLSRLKKRLVELVRAEVERQVADASELEDELAILYKSLSFAELFRAQDRA